MFVKDHLTIAHKKIHKIYSELTNNNAIKKFLSKAAQCATDAERRNLVSNWKGLVSKDLTKSCRIKSFCRQITALLLMDYLMQYNFSIDDLMHIVDGDKLKMEWKLMEEDVENEANQDEAKNEEGEETKEEQRQQERVNRAQKEVEIAQEEMDRALAKRKKVDEVVDRALEDLREAIAEQQRVGKRGVRMQAENKRVKDDGEKSNNSSHKRQKRSEEE